MKLLLLIPIFLVFSGIVYSVDLNQGNIENFLSDFLKEPLNSNFWIENFIEIISIIFAPILLIFILLFALLEQINLFRDQKLHAVLSILLTMFAVATNVYLGIVSILVGLGTSLILVAFFAVLFGVLLSYWAMKKGESFGFFFGSRFLTNFFIHLPLGFILVFASLFVGEVFNIGNLELLYYISLGALLISGILLFFSYKGDRLSVIFLILALVILEIYLFNNFDKEKVVFGSLGIFLFLLFLASERAKNWYGRNYVKGLFKSKK